MLRRRCLIAFVGGAAAVILPAPVARTQPDKTYRLGILINTRNDNAGVEELLKALRERGYVEGKNFSVDWRLSQGNAERWSELARELVALKVDAIYVQTTPAALAVKQVTSTIPIIIPTAIDPIGAGLAASLARPGGNVTGLAMMSPEISGKALSLLREAMPGLRRVAVLWNAGNPAFTAVWQDVESTARSEGLALVPQPVRGPQDFAPVFADLASNRPDGLLVLADALVGQNLKPVAEFTVQQHLPAVSTFRAFTDLGGLMSYGPSLAAANRKAADYVDRVLKGANPAQLPFQQPTTFELVINLKTARALDLALPSLLVTRADEVIE